MGTTFLFLLIKFLLFLFDFGQEHFLEFVGAEFKSIKGVDFGLKEFGGVTKEVC